MATVESNTVTQSAPAEEIRAVKSFLNALALRLRLASVVRFVSLGILCSSLLLIGLRAAALIFPSFLLPNVFSWTFVAAIYIAPMPFAVVAGMSRRFELVTLARYADERMGLKDLLSTTVSIRLSLIEPVFAERLASTAATAVASVKLTAIAPVKWRNLQTAAAVVTAFTLLLLAAPASPLSSSNGAYLRLADAVNRQSRPGGVPKTNLITLIFPRRSSVAQKTSPDRNAFAGYRPAGHTGPAGSTLAGKSNGPTVNNRGRSAVSAAQQHLQQDLAAAEALLDRLDRASGLHGAGGQSGKLSKFPAGMSNLPGGAGSHPPSALSGHAKDYSNIPTLGEKLREFANRLAQRLLAIGEEQQAAQSLDEINHKLNGLQMPLTQGKLTAAEQDLIDDNQQQAIVDVRSAAYYADHEGATVPPGAQGGSGTPPKDSVLIPAKNAATGQGSERSSGQAEGAGQQGSSDSGSSAPGAGDGGKGSSQTSGGPTEKGQSGQGYGGGTEKPNFGAERWIDPAKLGKSAALPPISLPISNASGRSSDASGGSLGAAASTSSTVPYVRVEESYSAGEERGTVTGEQIPPADKDLVRKYFSSLTPGH